MNPRLHWMTMLNRAFEIFRRFRPKPVGNHRGSSARPALISSAGDIERNLDELLTKRLDGLFDGISGFEARLLSRWMPAFAYGYSVLELAREAGTAWLNHKRRGGEVNPDQTDGAVLRLHMKMCQIASEVFGLMRTGHADGALGRWRSLHEAVVVATFLRQSDAKVAEKFSNYLFVQKYLGLTEYQRFAPRLGFDRLDSASAKVVKRHYRAIVGHMSPDERERFSSPFGWAAEAIGKKRVVLEDLEEAAGLGRYRPVYRWSNDRIHATPNSLLSSLGDPTRKTLTLAGPSNVGFTDPAQFTCLHLAHGTRALVNTVGDETRPQWADEWLELMDRMTMVARDTFFRIEKEIEAEEANRS